MCASKLARVSCVTIIASMFRYSFASALAELTSTGSTSASFTSLLGQVENNISDCIPDTNSGEKVLIIEWDKTAIIGLSCILGSMLLITGALFYFLERKDPTYTFNLTFKKDRYPVPFSSVS
jgi:hypothetical protein